MLSALFLLVLAAAAIASGVGVVRKAARMRRFVSTPATVVAREVVAIRGDRREAIAVGVFVWFIA